MTAGPPGVLIAAPASGSGKTTVTLALLRHLRRRGLRVASIKVGPDYIDPGFHEAASGRPCLNLDPWAMRLETLAAALRLAGHGADLIVGEGVMGLFDGADLTDGQGLAAGSTAALAVKTGWPVILVIDCQGMGASVAALALGFARFHAQVRVAGVILNAVASDRHERLLRNACRAAGMPVLASLRRSDDLKRPARHLGLVQAAEDPALDAFLESAADGIGAALDEPALIAAARPARIAGMDAASMPETPQAGAQPPLKPPLRPLGRHIAVARDIAFAFCYPLLLQAWRDAGAQVSFFSPLADEAPDADADAVYFPGGYPELHAAALAGNRRFHKGLQAAVVRDAVVYGECGGYMVLGNAIEDAAGQVHEMLGLLPITTSLRAAARSLGYRRAELCGDGPLGPRGGRYRAHEFHYASIQENGGEPLFQVTLAGGGQPLGPAGHRQGRVMGSFLHLIDGEESNAEGTAALSGFPRAG